MYVVCTKISLLFQRINDFARSSRDYFISTPVVVNAITVGATKADLLAFATWPLTSLGISKFVLLQTRQQQGLPILQPNLPFNVQSQVKSHVAQVMIDHLQKDAEAYSTKENEKYYS